MSRHSTLHPPPAVPGIPAWPASCNGTSSCTAQCSGKWSGSVSVLCGPDSSWLPPQQTCQPQQPDSQDISGTLTTITGSVIMKSNAQIAFTMKFKTSLPAAAGAVKLFTCSAAGTPLQFLTDMQPAAAGDSTYSASLALQGPQLGSFSSSPGVLRFTAVVGGDNSTTGAVALMQVLPGCADGPAAAPPGGGWPWIAKPCASAAVGQQCFTTCNWPAYDGSGYYVTCLPDGSWSGPGGFCFPRSCSGSPGPEWANSSCASMSVGSQCTAACNSTQQGVGFIAECTIGGWQVTARDCSDVAVPPVPPVPTTCSFLPTPNAPAGSKGWSADCAGRANGGTCRAACDGLNSFFGQGYTAVCQAGQWTVQPGAGCNVCASSQAFVIKGGSLANGGIFGFPYAILPTNDGASVLVADSQGNRVTRYSARDLSYEGQWTGLNTISGLAQAHGTNGNVYVAGYANGALRELAYPSGNLVRAPNVGLFYQQLAVDSAGKLWAANYNDGVLKCWDAASSFTVLETFRAPDGVNGRFSPIGVAIDPRTGNVLASDYDNGRVVAFSSDGTFLREVITGFPAYTTAGLAVGSAGNIYLPIYDEIGGQFKYDSNGKLLAKYGGALRYPWAVSVGADGVVWVTEEISGARKITCM